MTEITGLLAADVAKTIITVMGWQRARTKWFGPQQERIEHHDDGRWIGVTSSVSHTWVTLHAGRIRADGTFADSEADSKRLDGTDQAALALAARQLWERLDELEPPKKSL
ncbi:hypothetical protein [Streptomyces spectabilis]|uniref:Uncharacterized protein n=1 Tax=Streptomyces spectabilis TaxID=68270 RepID=A0A7W8B2K8_STRST|nr:hypothetical protein [Streptomyces spectabilis]MBB5109141.1 hypothetical protein [Streptomyces spectabilis]MCI3907689.1 hypothetical protein [Streptomyces spectabilis]MCI3907703.1 hypothetical protein [Streptomyces spectabilis]GGV51084.1 hypothetical protein GCM10010245_80320 [Streptomyces spectabilis]